MAKIQFEGGQVVEFDGNPTPEDVDHVAKQLGISSSNSTPNSQPKSFGQNITDAITRVPGVYLNDAVDVAKGTFQAITHPMDVLMGVGKFMFDHPIDNIVNAAKQITPQGTMDYLNNHPISAAMNVAGAVGAVGTGLSAIGKANDLPALARVGQNMTNATTMQLKPAVDAVKSGIAKVGDTLTGVPKDYEPIIAKNANEFRKIINPGKPEIKTFEKAGKDINKSFELATKEKLIIHTDPTGKLDTKLARLNLEDKIAPLEQKLQDYLSTSDKTFNIDDLAAKVRTALRKAIPVDKDYLDALKDLNDHVQAIVQERGENISAAELNKVKRGMWSVGYNQMRPTNKTVARAIGSVAKDAIEEAFPGGQVGTLNKKLGDYLSLDQLLEDANGRVVNKGRIGKYGAQLTGALVGHTIKDVPVIGPIVGHVAGGKLSDFLNDPERLTTNMAKRLKGFKDQPIDLPLEEINIPDVKNNVTKIINSQKKIGKQ